MANIFTYLDNNSTTRISDSVRDAMMPYIEKNFGNPSNKTSIGIKAKTAIATARVIVAEALGCMPEEILFTSGGSESNCIAINTCINACANKKIIITSPIEHDSVRMYLKHISNEFKVCEIPVDSFGNLCSVELSNIDYSRIGFCSIMLVNNEIGNIYPIQKIVHELKSYNNSILFHCDAVQALNKINISVSEIGIDYLTISGHKIHAPKGVGALYVRKNAPFTPLIFGHQERGFRGGTENVASIVGFGQAIKDVSIGLNERNLKIANLRNQLEREIRALIPDVGINGDINSRVSNTTNLYFPQVDSLKLLYLLEKNGIFVSTGSACNGEHPQESHVLKAIKSPHPKSSIRISLCEQTDEYDIKYFVSKCSQIIHSIRGGN